VIFYTIFGERNVLHITSVGTASVPDNVSNWRLWSKSIVTKDGQMTRITKFNFMLALVLAAACSSERTPPTRAVSPDRPAASLLTGGRGEVQQASLIECPSTTTQTSSTLIGPEGGILAVGNTRVVVPANAVLFPTTFSLTVPASKYVEIDVKAVGIEHFQFLRPVIVTIDYGHCNSPDIAETDLSVWNIDPVTKALLEQMPSVENKLTRTITFATIHFSGYAVAD
jgi:hypothetical protein